MSASNDSPAVKDLLERKTILYAVGNRIHSCDAPQVFAISGAWGSGKTSFLRQLQRYISKTCSVQEGWVAEKDSEFHPDHENVSVVWFEAWRYQHETAPIIALLHEIRNSFSRITQAKIEVGKLSEVAFRASLAVFDKALEAVKLSGLSKVQEVGEKWEADRFYTPLGSETIRQQFEYAIDHLLGKNKDNKDRKLVVLIDDLDRCEPQSAFRLLEGMKIYLNLKNCVFVLGMNQTVVEQGIAQLYKDTPGVPHHIAQEYLEKICQNVWHLPLITEPHDFLKKSLGIDPDETQNHSRMKETDPKKIELFGLAVELCREYNLLPRNARKIKVFSNILDRISDLYVPIPEEDKRRREVALVLVVAYLYQYCQPIFRVMQVEPDFYSELLVKWVNSGSRSYFETTEHERKLLPPAHPAFAHLELVQVRRATTAETASPNTDSLDNVFPDPIAEGFLRIQQLIRDNAVMPNPFREKYLSQW